MRRLINKAAQLTLALSAAILIASPAGAAEKPFEPIFEVNPATPSADAPVQIQILFELPEGHSFIKSASFRIPAAYQIPNSDDIPNGDVIGDGTLALKVGALGAMNVGLCAANHAPNSPGAHATIDIAVQIGGGDPGSCTGLLNLTLTIKKFPDGQYGFDFSLPRDVVGQQLDTPLQLIVNLFSVTKPNSNVNPPTPGGATVIRNPKEPGNYQWTLKVEDIEGRVKNLTAPTRVDASKGQKKESSGLKIPPAAFVGGGVVLALIIGAAVMMLRRKKSPAWEGGDSGHDYYYDEHYEGAGYDHDYSGEGHSGGEWGHGSGQPEAQQGPTGGYAPPSGSAGGYDPNAHDHGS
ncbi:MAG: hypothetical protein DCC49_00235 [Acidobacteria bacterium]|nr:MAG: hypothetical protein DCC49_00235 [Acidobacteriota bacterium]